jgi:hypothetical protein
MAADTITIERQELLEAASWLYAFDVEAEGESPSTRTLPRLQVAPR